MTSEERLIAIETKLDLLMKHFDNHLSQSFKEKIIAWGIILTAIIGFIVK